MDTHIADLLDKKRYAQATKVLQNKLKKSPNDVGLLIAKAEIQLAFGGIHLQSCRDHCADLCTRKPPITNHEHVIELYDVMCRLSAKNSSLSCFQEASTLWLEAIRASSRPQQKVALAEEWTSQAIQHRDWAMLAQAALHSHRTTPANSREKKRYLFWHLTARFLTSQVKARGTTSANIKSIDPSKNINRQLAIASLKKLVKDVPEDQGTESLTSHGQWISHPSELRLLCRMYEDFDEHLLLHDTLNQKKLSNILQQDYAFIYAEGAAVAKSTQQTMLWDWAKEHLMDAYRRDSWFEYDNWHIWESILHGFVHITNEHEEKFGDAAAATMEFTDISIRRSPSSRSPQLMGLQVSYLLGHAPETPQAQSMAVMPLDPAAFRNYFMCNASRGFVVEDLHRFVCNYTDEQYGQLRLEIGDLILNSNQDLNEKSQLSWLISEINLLSLDYLRLKSKFDDVPAAELIPKVEKLVSQGLRLYQISRSHTAKLPTKTMEPGDVACHVACSALSLCYSKTADSTYGFRATCLLAFLAGESIYDFDGRIELVELALTLGLPLVAWQAYKGLDVKKILHESLAPLMFNRISVLHPLPTRQLDPYVAMKVPLQFYDNSLEEVAEYQEMALQHDNYVSAVEMKEFADQLRDSPTRVMMIFERRRIARLTGKGYDLEDLTFDETSPPDPATIPESKTPPILAASRYRIFSNSYIAWLIALDAVVECVACEEQEQTQGPKMAYARECCNRSKDRLETEGTNSKLGSLEHTISVGAELMLNIREAMSSSKNNLPSDLLNELAAFITNTFSKDQLGSSTRKTFFLPPMLWYNHMYLSLEFCQTCNKFTKLLQAHIKRQSPPLASTADITSSIGKMQTTISRCVKDIHEETVLYKSKISTAVEENTYVQQATGIKKESDGGHGINDEILRVMGYDNVKKRVLEFVTSAQSALDGVLGVKL